MASTIPEKLYVTIQYRKDSTDGLLGFASPYTKDAPFAKRKETQDNWAYGYSAKFTIADDESIAGEFSANAKFDAMMLFGAGCYPRIVDNSLQDGFEIAKSVRRSGWGGGGNVVWRIADPRGYELEISSENFARVLDCTTIANGVIQGKCCWGRDGNKNILLPEASDVYQDALSTTNKIKNKITIGEVNPGDTIELLNKGYENKKVEYLGRYKMVTGGSEDDSPLIITTAKDQYLIKVDGKFEAMSNLSVALVITKSPTVFDCNQFAKDYRFDRDQLKFGYRPIHIITPDKITVKQINVELVDSDFIYDPAIGFPRIATEHGTLHTYTTYDSVPLITEYNGKTYITYSDKNYNGVIFNELREINPEALRRGKIEYVKPSGFFNKSLGIIKMGVPSVPLSYKRIVLQYNGITYDVNNIGYY